MMPKAFYSFGTIYLLLFIGIESYDDGIGEEACIDMEPRHDAYPQTSEPPFEIKLSKSSYSPNDAITVSLKGIKDTKFRGFLLNVRSGQDIFTNIGTFDHTDTSVCTKQLKNSYVSHHESSYKDSVTFTWNAPNNSNGDIVFLATVVQEKKKYWMHVNTTLYAAKSPTNQNSECGKTKGCYNCEKGCLITWKPNPVKKVVDFEFILPTNEPSVYLALGLSDDRKMGGDSVIECVQGATQAVVQLSHNYGYTNKIIATYKDLIVNQHVSFEDGVLKCTFSIPIRGEEGYLPPLDNKWYLEYAVGHTGANLKKFQHDRKAVTTSRYDLTKISTVTVHTANLGMVHGYLMIYAWVFFNSMAIFVAHNYKDAFPDKKILGKKIWFQVHRFFIGGTALFALISFIIIMVNAGGYSSFGPDAPTSHVAHPVLGFIILFLLLVNILLGIFKPGPNSVHRPFFKWVHLTIGLTCHVLSTASVFTGIVILKTHSLNTTYGIMIFLVVYNILINSGLTIISKYYLEQENEHPSSLVSKMKIFKNVMILVHAFILLTFSTILGAFIDA